MYLTHILIKDKTFLWLNRIVDEYVLNTTTSSLDELSLTLIGTLFHNTYHTNDADWGEL